MTNEEEAAREGLEGATRSFSKWVVAGDLDRAEYFAEIAFIIAMSFPEPEEAR